jgi:catechol 2,3-dioxygenase-like lactoylglutathione lyase family enzyme
MDLTINSLQHIGIPVTNIARSEAFYKQLGFSNAMQAPFTMDGETGTCIMMKRDSAVIELYQMPSKQLAEIKDRKDGRIDHIAFDVPDADKAMATLRHNGFNVVEDSPVKLNFWKKGVKFFFITGPDGERLEFNQVL